jgi:hypothetical protein
MAKRPKTYMDYYLNVMKKAVTRITVVMIIVKKYILFTIINFKILIIPNTKIFTKYEIIH